MSDDFYGFNDPKFANDGGGSPLLGLIVITVIITLTVLGTIAVCG